MKKIIVIHNVGLKFDTEKDFQIVSVMNNVKKIEGNYDFVVCANTVPPETDLKKCILILTEPPHTAHRRYLYGLVKKNFHTVLTFNPDPEAKNQFAFGENPIVYPYHPALSYDIIRKDTTLRKRGVYWAGHKPKQSSRDVPDCFNSINMMGVRADIALYLKKSYPQAIIMGSDWGTETKDKDRKLGWRLQKQKDLDENEIDFHLCMENSMLPGYISEKIHDGFSSDRVVLYLGNPDIENYVPKEAFVNLNPLFNKETKEFDYKKLTEILTTMTQEEYDSKLKAAREWRKTLKGKWEAELARTNQFVIDRINGK